MHAVTFRTVTNGIETIVETVISNDKRTDAAAARHIRNTTGLETRVYDDFGLRGIFDAIAA